MGRTTTTWTQPSKHNTTLCQGSLHLKVNLVDWSRRGYGRSRSLPKLWIAWLAMRPLIIRKLPTRLGAYQDLQHTLARLGACQNLRLWILCVQFLRDFRV